MQAADDLYLEVIKITPRSIPWSRLRFLADSLGGEKPRPNLTQAELWVYNTTRLFLHPETSTHTFEGGRRDFQLILWDGSKMMAELYGALYPDGAIVSGIHSDTPGGGTRLMRAFARLAGPLPIRLNATSPALGFYRRLGLRRLKAQMGHNPMVWPRPMQTRAARSAIDEI